MISDVVDSLKRISYWKKLVISVPQCVFPDNATSHTHQNEAQQYLMIPFNIWP